MKGSGIFARK